jgi:hypothetical protein
MADWYYAKEGRQHGPISAAQLKQLAQSGELQPDDLVFGEGAKDWVAASTVRGLFSSGGSGRSGASARASAEPQQSFNFDAAAPAPPDEDDRPSTRRSSRPSRGGGGFMDLLMFRRMVAPPIIIFLFYLTVILIILGGLGTAVAGLMSSAPVWLKAVQAVGSLIMIPVLILVYRMSAEVMIVLFRIYETLTEIRKQQDKQREQR